MPFMELKVKDREVSLVGEPFQTVRGLLEEW